MDHPPFTALAAVYDAIMQDVEYDHWADFVLTYARDGGLEAGPDGKFNGKRALDLACGTGGFTAQLQQAGLLVTGLDSSPDMLNVARERLPGVTFEQGDLRHFELLGRFDLITCVFDSLNNLLEPAELEATFRRCHQHLSAGGLLACDLNTQLGVRELWENDALEGLAPIPDGSEVHYHWSHHHDGVQNIGVVQAFCRVMSPGGEVREFVETHRERGYDPQEVGSLLLAAGFTRFEMVEYPDYAVPDDKTPRIWVFAWKEKR